MEKVKLFRLSSVASLLTVVMLLCSCRFNDGKPREHTRVFNISYFSSIQVSAPVDVVFVQGDKPSCQIVGKAADVEAIDIKNVGETLVVSIGSHKTVWLNGNCELRITSPDLVGVALHGNSDFACNGKLDTDTLLIDMQGSCDATLGKVVCNYISVNASGSGDFKASLIDAQLVKFATFGSGDIEAQLKNVDTTNASTHGCGDIQLSFTDCGVANCNSFGSGDIKLRGTIESINKNMQGSGDLDDKGLKINSCRK